MLIIVVTFVLGWSVMGLTETIRASTGFLGIMVGWIMLVLSWGFILAGIGLLAMLALLIPAMIPAIKLSLTTFVLRKMNPSRVRKAMSRPHVEIQPKDYDNICCFDQKMYGLKFWIVDYQFPMYKISINPEVMEWCDQSLDSRPQILPPKIPRAESGVRIFLLFSTPNDAMAFKLRWL